MPSTKNTRPNQIIPEESTPHPTKSSHQSLLPTYSQKTPHVNSKRETQKITSLIQHYERILTLCCNKFKTLKEIDDTWIAWSSAWLQSHQEIVDSWTPNNHHNNNHKKQNSASVPPPAPSHNPPATPHDLDYDQQRYTPHPSSAIPGKKPKPPKSKEEALKKQISRLQNARISCKALGEPIPPEITDAFSLFGTKNPPRWLTDKEKSELDLYYSLLQRTAVADLENDYDRLVAIVFDVTTVGFDRAKFEEWVEGVAVEQVFSVLGTLIAALPFVPDSVGPFIKSFGAVYSKSKAITSSFHKILSESSSFLILLMNVNKTISESQESHRLSHTPSHSGIQEMKQLLQWSIERYQSQVAEITTALQEWAALNFLRKFWKQLNKRGPDLNGYIKELEEIRVGVRDEVLMHVGAISGRTLDSVQDGFKTIHDLEESKARLETVHLALVQEKRKLEGEKRGLEKDKVVLEGEKKMIKQSKAKLKEDVERLEELKNKLSGEKDIVEKEVQVLIYRRDQYARLNVLHRDVGKLAIDARSALLAAGDKGLGLGGHLLHGAVVYDTAKDLVLKAISKIQEMHDISVDLQIPFEPSLFEHFSWRDKVGSVKFKYQDYTNNQWDLIFSSDLEWLYGFNGDVKWSIPVRTFTLENSCIPPKFDPK
ncbi:hypothetical protein BDR26DRAFT_851793 [Obelidium mucronatum]|nr:hypothetical protein BDR26DRAFT_851793 [Obelidium mucronatum]